MLNLPKCDEKSTDYIRLSQGEHSRDVFIIMKKQDTKYSFYQLELILHVVHWIGWRSANVKQPQQKKI